MLLSWLHLESARGPKPGPRRGRTTGQAVAKFRPRVEALEDRRLLSGDAVLQWNTAVLDAIRVDRSTPQIATRAMTMMHVAVYDAVNAIDRTYTSYLVDTLAPAGASPEAAAAQAAHDILVGVFPAQRAAFDARLASSLADLPAGPALQEGTALGRFVAGRVLAQRRNDGSATVVPYTPRPGPGNWQPTPPGFLPPIHPNWPQVTPFALASGTQFRAPAPPALTSAEYTRNFNEVKALGALNSTVRTADETEIARFWLDGPGTTTPPGHWNRIAQDVARAKGTTLAQNARLFALLNIASADAGIVCWDAKYTYDFWRQITAIRNADTDGNPDTVADPNWTPLVVTPNHPSYPSGHATFSAASATVLASFFGTDNISFTSTSEPPLVNVTRSFASFSAGAREAARSRVLAGIHWTFDVEQGATSATAVANYVVQNFLRSRITPTERFVTQSYRDLLGREPDRPGLAAFAGFLDQGGSRAQVVQALVSSPEYRTAAVQGVYRALLRRDADAAGLGAFTAFLATGGTVAQVRAAVAGSAEYFGGRARGTNEGYITAVYQDFLGRAPEPAGAAGFAAALGAGTSRADVAAVIVNSEEANQVVVRGLYRRFLRREAEAVGLAGFVSILRRGTREEIVIAAIAGSEEYFARL